MKINVIFVKFHTSAASGLKRIRFDRMHTPAPFLIFRIPHSNVRIPDTSHLKHTYPFAMLFMQDWGYA
jgi:hypothetical protein